MDSAHQALLIKTRELIEATRHEISQLRDEIELTRDTVDQSQRFLSRPEPPKRRTAKRAKAL
jgi:hypothetical protein